MKPEHAEPAVAVAVEPKQETTRAEVEAELKRLRLYCHQHHALSVESVNKCDYDALKKECDEQKARAERLLDIARDAEHTLAELGVLEPVHKQEEGVAHYAARMTAEVERLRNELVREKLAWGEQFIMASEAVEVQAQRAETARTDLEALRKAARALVDETSISGSGYRVSAPTLRALQALLAKGGA